MSDLLAFGEGWDYASVVLLATCSAQFSSEDLALYLFKNIISSINNNIITSDLDIQFIINKFINELLLFNDFTSENLFIFKKSLLNSNISNNINTNDFILTLLKQIQVLSTNELTTSTFILNISGLIDLAVNISNSLTTNNLNSSIIRNLSVTSQNEIVTNTLNLLVDLGFFIKIYVDGQWVQYQPKVYVDGDWKNKQFKIYTGGTWQ